MERYDISVIENAVNTSSICQVNLYDKVIASCMKDYLEYRKDEEQKRLFQFPCKVGDTLYAIFHKNGVSRYEECEIEQIIIHAGIVEMNVLIKFEHIRSRLDMALFGKTVFLTEKEACQKLKELEYKTDF